MVAGLLELTLPSDTVRFSDQEIVLYPLGAAQIVFVVNKFFAHLAPLYEKAIAGQLPGDTVAVALELGEAFTPIAAHIIAAATDTSKRPTAAEIQIAARLPFSVQVAALDKIFVMTMSAEGGLEKLVEIVSRAALLAEKAQR